MSQQMKESNVQEIISLFHQLREKRSVQIRYDEFVGKALKQYMNVISDEQILKIVNSDKLTDRYIVNAVVNSGALSGEATLNLLHEHQYNVHMCELALDAHPTAEFFLQLLQKLQTENKTCFRKVFLYVLKSHKDVLSIEEHQSFEVAADISMRSATDVADKALSFLAA